MSQKRIFTEEEKTQILKMYNMGETYKNIAMAFHTKDTRISAYLKSIGCEKRAKNTLKNHVYLSKSRKYKVNEDYFEIIDSENKAYWLGFLYADGCVRKRYGKNGKSKGGSVELSLKASDRYHISNFLYDIGSNAPIIDKNVNLNGKEYKAVRVNISSIKMVNDLIDHGCIEKKSLKLAKPVGVPCDLVSHFIRGYFDGDGCVAFYPKKHHYTYSILGTEDFLNFVIQVSNIDSFSIIKFSHKKCCELKIYSKRCVEIFHNYIYAGKSIYLERKYQKSLSMMKFCNLHDSRNNTQKMADLLNTRLYIDDCLIDDFYFNTLLTERSETAAMAGLLD